MLVLQKPEKFKPRQSLKSCSSINGHLVLDPKVTQSPYTSRLKYLTLKYELTRLEASIKFLAFTVCIVCLFITNVHFVITHSVIYLYTGIFLMYTINRSLL